MNEMTSLAVIFAISVYAFRYCYVVLRDFWVNRNLKFEYLLTPQFKELFADAMFEMKNDETAGNSQS